MLTRKIFFILSHIHIFNQKINYNKYKGLIYRNPPNPEASSNKQNISCKGKVKKILKT